MNNPITQQLGRSQALNNVQQVRQMMNTIRNAGNPQAMLQGMLMNNPQYRQVMDVINQNGGDPRKAFYNMCSQKGVNPQEILDMLK